MLQIGVPMSDRAATIPSRTKLESYPVMSRARKTTQMTGALEARPVRQRHRALSAWTGWMLPAVTLLAGIGCAGDLQEPSRFVGVGSGLTCSLAIDVQTDIFDDRCGTAACHEGSIPAAGVDLIAPGVATRLVGVSSNSDDCGGRVLIDPSDPDGSLFMQKFLATPPCGDAMPLNLIASQPPNLLSQAEIACVRAWAVEVSGAESN